LARSSWLLPGSSMRSSCLPRCACIWSLGAGDALSAQVVSGVLLWLLRDRERDRMEFCKGYLLTLNPGMSGQNIKKE
jgi:hypothetical protein